VCADPNILKCSQCPGIGTVLCAERQYEVKGLLIEPFQEAAVAVDGGLDSYTRVGSLELPENPR
jgi:hypothetical protein